MPITPVFPTPGQDPWGTFLNTALGVIRDGVNANETAIAGKANTSHTHAAADIVSGTIAAARLPTSSTTASGIVELATSAETTTGTDTVRATTPAGVAAALAPTFQGVNHGDDPLFARPASATYVIWTGSVTPVNKLPGDIVIYVADPPADPWTPAGVTGLHLWLDAHALGMYDTEPVVQWNDKSGLDNHVSQATVANQPKYWASAINGFPAVKFDGANDYLATAVSSDYVGAWTVYLVAQSLPVTLSTDSDNFFGGKNAVGTSTRLDFQRTTADLWQLTRSTSLSTGAIADDDPHMFRLVGNGASSSIEVDGVSQATGTTSLSGIGVAEILIGARGDLTRFLDGYVAEAIFIKGTVSGGDDTSIKAYLTARWGL